MPIFILPKLFPNKPEIVSPILKNNRDKTAIFLEKIDITIVEDIITQVAPVSSPFNSWSFNILLKNKAKKLLIKFDFNLRKSKKIKISVKITITILAIFLSGMKYQYEIGITMLKIWVALR